MSARSDRECENSYLPEVNQGGILRRWTVWPTGGLPALGGFGRSIVDSARAWVDEAQLVMPGYRDRIVTIYQDSTEGGMNLAMPPEVLARLTDRGAGAADKLIASFAGEQSHTPGSGWENHRWIRFRTATSGLEEWLAAFREAYASMDAPEMSYAGLAGVEARADFPSYRLPGGRRDIVNQRTAALLDLASQWCEEPADAFSFGAPAPRPRLRLVAGEGVARLAEDAGKRRPLTLPGS
jgi:hypothetical protein